MNTAKKLEQDIIKKMRELEPSKLAEVEDFVDFLRQRTNDRDLVRAASKLSEKSFARIWDNPEDAVYDSL